VPTFQNDNEIERADLYKLVATLFLQAPTNDVIVELGGIIGGIKIEESAHVIGHDFHDLFVHNTVPLYDLFYNYPLGEAPKTLWRATLEVRRFYESAGLTMEEELQIVPDHISAELLFMSYLAANERIDEQRTFIEEHLIKWVPVYCDAVWEHAKTGFYKQIAILLKELVSSDYEHLRGGLIEGQ
jgi:TorA maturation chaperone TorD